MMKYFKMKLTAASKKGKENQLTFAAGIIHFFYMIFLVSFLSKGYNSSAIMYKASQVPYMTTISSPHDNTLLATKGK